MSYILIGDELILGMISENEENEKSLVFLKGC
jgi:hypothetical protein